MGWIGDTYVAYGLGNFVWSWNSTQPQTGVLQVTLTGSTLTGASFIPAMVSQTTGLPMPVTGDQAASVQAKIDSVQSCTGLATARS